MHEARLDFTMLLGCIYLLIVGAGRWSLDALLVRSRRGGAENPSVLTTDSK